MNLNNMIPGNPVGYMRLFSSWPFIIAVIFAGLIICLMVVLFFLRNRILKVRNKNLIVGVIWSLIVIDVIFWMIWIWIFILRW